MKKIMKLGVICILFISLAGCGSKVNDDAIDAYITASQNMMNMKTADYSMKMNVDANNEKISLKAYGAYDARSDLQMNMMVDMSAVDSGNINIAELYVKDYIFYLNALGEKQAMTFQEYEKMLTYILENSSSKIDREKIKDMFVSAELKDGHLIMVMNADKIGFDEYMQNVTGDEAASLDMKLSDIKFDITLENDFINHMVMDMSISSNLQNSTPMNVSLHMTLGFTNLNTDRMIEMPDFSSYPTPIPIGDNGGVLQ